MGATLGNSGSPRWYDCDLQRFEEYLELLSDCGASGAEIVLHDGDADEFTSRVHVVREDWEPVIRRYRERDLSVSVHGPLTPEFSPQRWREEPDRTLKRYRPVLDQVRELSREQGPTNLVLHAITDRSRTPGDNERQTARFLQAILNELERTSSDVTVNVELRAYRPERASAAATTRASALRIVEQTESNLIGICWDLAHDLESRIVLGNEWVEPDEQFLNRVRHVHLHDLGPEDEPHYPPLTGRVPLESALNRLDAVPAIMEVRWRMAERVGEPWDVLRRSYRAVQDRRRS